MPNLYPLRDHSEHEVLNFFAMDGAYANDTIVRKGTLVKLQGSGFVNTDDPTEDLGSPGASYSNTVSLRYGIPFKVQACETGAAGTQDQPVGITLWDVRETDENGEKLLFNPRKAAEMKVALSGQAVPVLTRGVILYSGNLTSGGQGTVAVGADIYAGAGGELTTASDGKKVGKTLGTVDSNSYVLLKLEL